MVNRPCVPGSGTPRTTLLNGCAKVKQNIYEKWLYYTHVNYVNTTDKHLTKGFSFA